MRKITMKPVSSSQIESVGYDENLQDLYIEFKKGAVYRYLDVPQVIYERLCEADSIGSYFAKTIKGVYDYQKMEFAVVEGHIHIS